MYSPERKRMYKKVWRRVKESYFTGFMVSERGLQGVLSEELKKGLPQANNVVVEPKWTMADGRQRTPDIVIVEEGKITDIFELKFVPHYYARWQDDIERLPRYIKNPDVLYPVNVNLETGRWDQYLPVQEGCRLHFVAVAQSSAQAVRLPLDGEVSAINHWFGRTGDKDGEWDIRFACDQ